MNTQPETDVNIKGLLDLIKASAYNIQQEAHKNHDNLYASNLLDILGLQDLITSITTYHPINPLATVIATSVKDGEQCSQQTFLMALLLKVLVMSQRIDMQSIHAIDINTSLSVPLQLNSIEQACPQYVSSRSANNLQDLAKCMSDSFSSISQSIGNEKSLQIGKFSLLEQKISRLESVVHDLSIENRKLKEMNQL